MKVLISAYACEPNQGSEPGVGWNFVREMSKHHELWVLTQSDGRSAIEKELRENPVDNLNFIYFDPLGWELDLWKAKSEIQLHYYLWQVQAYFIGKNLQKSHHFDLIHHVTFVKYWGPSFLSLLDVPFLWGPVGGGEFAPRSFWKDFSFRGKLYEVFRHFAQRVGEADPFTRVTAKRCALAQAATDDTAKRLQHLGVSNLIISPEAALSQQDLAHLKCVSLPKTSPIRFISVGRLLHWKGYHLSLQAFIKANIPDSEYWLLGTGPEENRLKEISEHSPMSNQIKFFGKVPRPEVLEALTKSHALLHPSLHDSGGWACLEAMASGRPVICLDLGGPAIRVTKDTGIKIPAQSPQQAIDDIAAAMLSLNNDRERLSLMGQKARERVESRFSWDKKIEDMLDTYDDVVSMAMQT